MDYKRYKENKNIFKDIEPLYLSAFPEDERPPVFWLLKCLDADKDNDIIAYYDDGFIGFSYITLFEGYCYILFLAVKDEYRNKGYGSKILSFLKEKYANSYTLYLAREEINEKYSDLAMRIRRRDFYVRNGFIDNPLKISEYGVVYQTMRFGTKTVTFDIYKKIYIKTFGQGALKYLEFISNEKET